MKNNILVTGAAGFIGANFAEFFVNRHPDYNVIVLDKLTYAGNMDNLKKVMDKITFEKGDICDFEFVTELFKKYDINGVIHFAAESHVDNSIKTPFIFTQTNVLGTHTLLEVAKQLLCDDGTIFVHADWHETHYEKILLDEIFGRNNLINEIIWCYTGPGSPKMQQLNRKHDTIFWYAKNAGQYTFNKDDIRVPYTDPNQSFRKAFDSAGDGWTEDDLKALRERGRVPDDWWDDIAVAARSRVDGVKRTGYLTEKPPKLMERIIKMASKEGDIVLDFFAGSGTTLYSAANLNRQYIGIEQLADTQELMIKRMSAVSNFVYCNIKNDANKFREKVQAADDKKMDDLLKEVLNSSFLSYRIDSKNHNIRLGDFHKLSLADKKHVLLDLIDNNTLYLNYSEIDDATYKISDEDKKHNKAFYGE